MDFAAEVKLHAEAQTTAVKIGRQQMARDVMTWAREHAAALQGAPVESLLALCNRELK